MPRLLKCIFSYERYALLLNLMRSMDEFFPWGDVLVIDDHSSDGRIGDCLKRRSLADPTFTFHIADKPSRSSRLGGLYANMEFARQYALGRNYDLIFFLQDDIQFVWRDEQFFMKVEQLLNACGDAAFQNPLFCKRVRYIGEFEYIQSGNAYRTCRGFTAVSIAPVSLFRDNPDFTFFDTEQANSLFWLKRQKRAYFAADPVVCFIPLTYASDGTPGVAADSPGPGRYYIKPLDEGMVNRLTTRDRSILPFSEDYIEPIGTCRFPHWWSAKFEARYYALCGRTFLQEVLAWSFPVRVKLVGDCSDAGTLVPGGNSLQKNEQTSASRFAGFAQFWLKLKDAVEIVIGRVLYVLFSLVVRTQAERNRSKARQS